MSWILAALRRLRAERATAVALCLVVLVTTALFAAAPRMLEQVADHALRGDVAAAAPAERNLSLTQTERIAGSSDDPFGAVDQTGRTYAAELPAQVQAVFAGQVAIAETPRWLVTGSATPDMLTLRVQGGIDGEVRYVEGRAPAARTSEVAGTDPSQQVTRFEVAVSRTSAQAMRLSVGQSYTLTLDPLDILNRGRDAAVAVQIVGVYEPVDATAPYWSGEPGPLTPVTVTKDSNTGWLLAAAILAPGAYPALLDATRDQAGVGGQNDLPFRYTWRYIVDANRFHGAAAEDLASALHRTEGIVASDPVFGQGTQLQTGLLPLVDHHVATWRAALAVMATIAVGPLIVAGAAIALIVAFGLHRRRDVVATWLGRGASWLQLAVAAAAEALLLVVPAALVGLALAVIALPEATGSLSLVLAAGLAVFVIVVSIVLGVRSAQGPVGQAAVGRSVAAVRSGPTGVVARPRRLVFEALVVVLAVVGAYILRERGTHGASSTGSLSTPDPMIAAVPALVGLAAGLVATRVAPVPLRALATVAAVRRDLVPVLGLRRAVRGGSGAGVLVVLLATAAIGAFCGATLVQLDRSAIAIGWQEVGAPVQVAAAGASLPAALQTAQLPGVDAAAAEYRATIALGTRGAQLDLLVVDAAALQALNAGTPADPSLPDEMLSQTGEPLPAVIGSSVTQGPDGVAVGSTFMVRIGGQPVHLKAVEARDSFPTLEPGDRFVVISRDQLRAIRQTLSLAPTTLFLGADPAQLPALRTAVDQLAPTATVVTPDGRAAALRHDPIVDGVATAIAASAAVAGAYAALALALALALAGSARAREQTQLRTLGVTSRQGVSLMVVEHGPIVVLALVAGVVLGLALFVLVEPGLGLRGLLGSALVVPFSIGLDQLAAVAVGVVAVAALGIAAGIALQRRVVLATALRLGAE